MRKLTVIIMIVAASLLAACSSQPTPTPAPVITQAPAVEQAPPTQTATAVPLVENTPAPADSSAAVTFKLIPGESQLKYEVGEVFLNDNNRFATAVGVTSQVAGEISVDMSAPQNSTVGPMTADISTLTSDSGRRDGAIRNQFLESSKYPMVTFVTTQIEGLPAAYQEGEDINLTISGDLTIREVTKPVTFTAILRVAGGALTGEAVTTILMSDFGFGPINLAGILKTENQAKVTLTIVAKP